MAVSNNAVGAINVVALLLSLPIIGTGIWLFNQPENSCVKILQWPVIILGVFILIVSLVGIVGGFWRVPQLLVFYLIAMLILIVLLGILVGFIFMVTSKGSGHPAPARAFMEYRLEDFSGFLQQRVHGPFKWPRIMSCLSSAGTCSELNQVYRMAQDFFNASLSPLESGCCKPPTDCGFTFLNPTNWISPINTAANMDCLAWSNDPNQLCYSCDSCKGGLLATLRSEWKKANVILIITLIALIGVYLIGCCCAISNNAKTDEVFRKYKQGQGYT